MSTAQAAGIGVARWRLFAHVLSLEVRKQMSYRADFWLNALVAFATELAVAFFVWQAIYRSSGQATIGGYSFDGVVVYYVVVLMVGRLARGRERDLAVSNEIYEGTLTRYLLYPAPWVGFKLIEQVGSILPSLVQMGFLALAFSFALPMPSELGITPWTVAMAIPAILGANLLWFLLRLPVQMVAFWADNVWSLNVMLRFSAEILGGMMLPLAFFPDAVRAWLDWLPFGFVFSFPTLTLLGQVGLLDWLRGMAVLAAWCLVLAVAARAVWRRGLLSYTGVGI